MTHCETTIHSALLALALLAGPARAQDKTATKPDPEQVRAQQERARRMLLESLDKQGVKLDLDKRTLTIPAWVNDPPPPDPIEYVLVHARGKKHEAVLVTDVKASILNGALILLGFTPGKNAILQEKNPLPPREEIEKGAPIYDVIAPSGMQIWITVIREVEGGKTREDAIEDWLVDATTGRAVEDASFVYLGGRESPLYRNEPPVFVGDYEGNLFSSCYMMPENHLVTMSHARANDDQNWLINPAYCPPPGTRVTLVLHRQETAAHKARAARIAIEKKTRPPESRPTASQPATQRSNAPR